MDCPVGVYHKINFYLLNEKTYENSQNLVIKWSTKHLLAKLDTENIIIIEKPIEYETSFIFFPILKNGLDSHLKTPDIKSY